MPSALTDLVRAVPDFPKPGVLFRDISPLLQQQLPATVALMTAQFSTEEWQGVDALVGIESRGFILAAAMALALGKGLLLVRKPGKLPPPVLTVRYALEYGEDALQIAAGMPAQRVVVVDDVLATGGTLRASCELCAEAGHAVVGMTTLINLPALNQFAWRGLQPRCPMVF